MASLASSVVDRDVLRLLGLVLVWMAAEVVPGIAASWMYLGVASLGTALSPSSGPQCNLVPGLVYQQIRVCQENPRAIPCVGLGARLGIHECHWQFKFERWNCTTGLSQTVFGDVLKKGTKETAFVHAITSAGVVHAITTSCSAGNLTDCSCDMTQHPGTPPPTGDGWTWGGCSDNVDYGIWFARTFVDAPEKLKHATTNDVRALVNMHNNEVGRMAIRELMNKKCRCHGVSGSCAVKTCWKVMPHFRNIGSSIKRKYEKPIQVAPKSKKFLRRREKRSRERPITEAELVFVDRSPNYCRQNMKRNIFGTRGRQCNSNSKGQDSCDLLCCGRGYNTEIVRTVERCQCKFIWCCEVKCKTCETLIEKTTCPQ